MTTMTEETAAPRLTEVCWPVFDFIINFARQARHGTLGAPEQVRYEGLTALRDAEDLARGEPVTERAWEDYVKRMLVYFIDYKMITTEWPGREYWFDNRFETDAQVLNEVEALGGERFFQDCDETLREYEQAERRERRDRYELAERLGLYFVCLRLGFQGQFHDRPQELADYSRRLFMRLPAYSATRAKEMFPDAYKHNEEVKVDYKLGMKLTVVLAVLGVLIVAALLSFRYAWDNKTRIIGEKAEQCMSVLNGS